MPAESKRSSQGAPRLYEVRVRNLTEMQARWVLSRLAWEGYLPGRTECSLEPKPAAARKRKRIVRRRSK